MYILIYVKGPKFLQTAVYIFLQTAVYLSFEENILKNFCDFLQTPKNVSPRSDSSGFSGVVNGACAAGSTKERKMAAGMFNRDASFDDNRSDIVDDDDDRGFFQMNESDEGMFSGFYAFIAVKSLCSKLNHVIFVFTELFTFLNRNAIFSYQFKHQHESTSNSLVNKHCNR